MRFSGSVASEQNRTREIAADRRAAITGHNAPRRTRHLAAAALGAHDPRRSLLCAAIRRSSTHLGGSRFANPAYACRIDSTGTVFHLREVCFSFGRTRMRIELPLPPKIDALLDGVCYEFPSIRLKSNEWTAFVLMDDVIFKIPTMETDAEYHGLLELPRLEYERSMMSAGRRTVREDERPENFDNLATCYPNLAKLLDHPTDVFPLLNREIARPFVYFLMLQKLNYEFLLKSCIEVAIPETKFVFLARGSAQFWPAVVQRYITAIPLSRMFSVLGQGIKRRYRHFRPDISRQLLSAMNDEFRELLDFSPNNWLFDEKEKKLYYVDTKPTLLIRQSGNAHNRRGLVRFFVNA
jgi:hypothetical protein